MTNTSSCHSKDFKKTPFSKIIRSHLQLLSTSMNRSSAALPLEAPSNYLSLLVLQRRQVERRARHIGPEVPADDARHHRGFSRARTNTLPRVGFVRARRGVDERPCRLPMATNACCLAMLPLDLIDDRYLNVERRSVAAP